MQTAHATTKEWPTMSLFFEDRNMGQKNKNKNSQRIIPPFKITEMSIIPNSIMRIPKTKISSKIKE